MSRSVKNLGRLALLTLLACEATLAQRAETQVSTDSRAEPSASTQVIRYSLVIRNPTDRAVRNGVVNVYAPRRDGPWHRMLSIRATSAHTVEYDDSENTALRLEVSDLGPYGSLAVAIDAVLETRDESSTLIPIEVGRYTTADQLIESSEPLIMGLAKKLRRESHRESAEAIYKWVAESVRYTGYALEAKGALRALQDLEGDCTEYAYLVVALARSVGIPARAVGGFVLQDSGLFRAREQHDWAELYIDGKWWLVDAQRRVFSARPEAHYLGFRVTSPRSDKQPELRRFSATAPLLVEMP